MEGKVPPPVEGGAAVGDHLVKVPKDQNQRVALQNSHFKLLLFRPYQLEKGWKLKTSSNQK